MPSASSLTFEQQRAALAAAGMNEALIQTTLSALGLSSSGDASGSIDGERRNPQLVRFHLEDQPTLRTRS